MSRLGHPLGNERAGGATFNGRRLYLRPINVAPKSAPDHQRQGAPESSGTYRKAVSFSSVGNSNISPTRAPLTHVAIDPLRQITRPGSRVDVSAYQQPTDQIVFRQLHRELRAFLFNSHKQKFTSVDFTLDPSALCISVSVCQM
jgi:hypothetical protein